MNPITIPDHWDTEGLITAQSDPSVEFKHWQQHAAANIDHWNGDEFTLASFEEYIAGLDE